VNYQRDSRHGEFVARIDAVEILSLDVTQKEMKMRERGKDETVGNSSPSLSSLSRQKGEQKENVMIKNE
jgi:hypothetical protein